MKYQLTIPKPCYEDWKKMSATEKGKFCKSCNKEVLDFTQKTDAEITKLIKGKNNICGKFKSNQLDRDVVVLEKNHFSKIAASLALISTVAVSEPLFSQSKKDPIEVVTHQKETFYKENNTIEKFILINGVVKDTQGDLPGVSIVLKGTTIGTETDFDGKFSIKIPNKKRKSTILVFSYLGYKTEELNVLSIKKPVEIILQENESILGGISVGMIVTAKKPNIFKQFFNLFRKKENKRY